jgi:hypothetical protein
MDKLPKPCLLSIAEPTHNSSAVLAPWPSFSPLNARGFFAPALSVRTLNTSSIRDASLDFVKFGWGNAGYCAPSSSSIASAAWRLDGPDLCAFKRALIIHCSLLQLATNSINRQHDT